jgi:hypothetical protein
MDVNSGCYCFDLGCQTPQLHKRWSVKQAKCHLEKTLHENGHKSAEMAAGVRFHDVVICILKRASGR